MGRAAVAAITSHCPSSDLHHVRCTSLEPFDAGVAPLCSHGMGNGLTLVLQTQWDQELKKGQFQINLLYLNCIAG